MFYAVASGSLILYGDVLKWARRYVRDPVSHLPLAKMIMLIWNLAHSENDIWS